MASKYLTGGTVTMNYDTYRALLTQSGTGSPTATVLDDTGVELTEIPTWSRVAVGQYRATTSAATFLANKTRVVVTVDAGVNGAEFKGDGRRVSDTTLDVFVRDAGGSLTDNWQGSVQIDVDPA